MTATTTPCDGDDMHIGYLKVKNDAPYQTIRLSVTDRQMERQTDRQTDRPTNRQNMAAAPELPMKIDH